MPAAGGESRPGLRKMLAFAWGMYRDHVLKPKLKEISWNFRNSSSLDVLGSSLKIPDLARLHKEGREVELACEQTDEGLVKLLYRPGRMDPAKRFSVELDVEQPDGSFEACAYLCYSKTLFGFAPDGSRIGGKAIYDRTTHPVIREIAFRASPEGIDAARAKYALPDIEKEFGAPGFLAATGAGVETILHRDGRGGFTIGFAPGQDHLTRVANPEKAHDGFCLVLNSPDSPDFPVLTAHFTQNANGRFMKDGGSKTADNDLLRAAWNAKDGNVRRFARAVLGEKPCPF